MHVGEIEIDIPLVRRLLAEQFPDLADQPVTVLRSTGTVNAVYRIGETCYARLPRLDKWAGSLLKEWTWLPKLAPQLSLQIPKPLALGQPASGYPFTWAIYQWIEGTPYKEDAVQTARQFVSDLANFVLELRSVPTQGAPAGGRALLAELDETTRAAIEASRGVIDTASVASAWAACLEAPPWNGEPVWIHSDLLKPNLLVQDGRLWAVIDFGSAGAGDPAMDVVPAWSVFDPVERELFRQALDVDEAAWSRGRAYALHQAVMIIPYYAGTNPEFVSMAKDTVGQVLADFE